MHFEDEDQKGARMSMSEKKEKEAFLHAQAIYNRFPIEIRSARALEYEELAGAARYITDKMMGKGSEAASGSMKVDFAIVSDKDGPIARIDFEEESDG